MHKINHYNSDSSQKLLRISIFITIVTIVTIALGSLFSIFFESYKVYTYSLTIILTVITLVLTAFALTSSGTFFKIANMRSKELDHTLVNLADYAGVQVEYIEDASEGRAYREVTNLVVTAKKNLTIISTWEPSTYSEDSTFYKLRKARNEYYEAIKRQIDRHRGSTIPFYRSIIQIPKEFENKYFIFKKDPEFFKYLLFCAQAQDLNPNAIILRETISNNLLTSFTIIDERYIILPIFAYNNNRNQMKQGVFIFDDYHGEFVKSLEMFFSNLIAHSHPLTLKQLARYLKYNQFEVSEE